MGAIEQELALGVTSQQGRTAKIEGKSYGIAIASELLAKRIFGENYELLDAVPGDANLPIVTAWDDAALERLADVDVLITGWGAPKLTDEVGDQLSQLTAVVHAGGATASLMTPNMRERLLLSSAGDANSIPVAEYSLAMILLSCKQVFRSQKLYRERRSQINREVSFPLAGNYGQTVGLVGASKVGRLLIELLRPFDLRILMHDPYLSEREARELGVELVSLNDVMSSSDVVSLHVPLNSETRGMIGQAELSAMRPNATLLNTARGAVIDFPALEKELLTGRIDAILDVTDPFEPLPSDSPLWDCSNVMITPHVAGSMGTELRRIGQHVAEEVARALRGEAFVAQVETQP
ncbi:hydroxyacid dehydrogenase [Salinibacterium sp. SWN139]|uniref:hydroxyacid dehydrogenase n=1 Tax=Salinibacterium sp. SWN139 TaxID=2792055 RepID=UPI0018CD4465|nr:hydroxyacid dehydrogenase [Salinibacterium sp. SWN139]MBH0052579.1 hydroxyacid dehydrogenase [Salinibacterium sp. SWN139]